MKLFVSALIFFLSLATPLTSFGLYDPFDELAGLSGGSLVTIELKRHDDGGYQPVIMSKTGKNLHFKSLAFSSPNKLLTGLAFTNRLVPDINPKYSVGVAGTLEINPETGEVTDDLLVGSGHSHESARAIALAVSSTGRRVISAGKFLLVINKNKPWEESTEFLNLFFTKANAITALAFSSGGKLYGWDQNLGLVTIDSGFSGNISTPVDFVKPVGKRRSAEISRHKPIESLAFTRRGSLIGIQKNAGTTFYKVSTKDGSVKKIGKVNARISAIARPPVKNRDPLPDFSVSNLKVEQPLVNKEGITGERPLPEKKFFPGRGPIEVSVTVKRSSENNSRSVRVGGKFGDQVIPWFFIEAQKSSQQVEFSFSPKKTGKNQTLKVIVDFDDEIQESDEKNNEVSLTGIEIVDCDDSTDSDHDALWDTWEENGIDENCDGVPELDLPSMGARVDKRDIFIEIDYMKGFQPKFDALKRVIDAFRKAPGGGINLHIDAGTDPDYDDLMSTEDPKTGKWSSNASGKNLSESNELKHIRTLDTWDGFDELKENNFSKPPSNHRRKAFHYAIYADRIEVLLSSGKASDGILGRGKTLGQDMIVSLGGGETKRCRMTGVEAAGAKAVHCAVELPNPLQEAVTFMHELGHNLGLTHGGFKEDYNRKFKPNYPSVMNYHYSVKGLRFDKKDGRLDYSHGTFNSLNERYLDEKKGITLQKPTSEHSHLGIRYFCPESNSQGRKENISDSLSPIDWNCNNDSTEVLKSLKGLDLDASGKIQFRRHKDHDDWGNLNLAGGGIGSALNQLFSQSAVEFGFDEPNFHEDQLRSPSAYGVSVRGPQQGELLALPGEMFLYPVRLTNLGAKADSYVLRGETIQGWLDLSTLPNLIKLDAGASRELMIEVAVPETATAETKERVIIRAKSQSNSYAHGTARTPVTVDLADEDKDRVHDTRDNCLSLPNPDQKDTDTNGIGDACEPRDVGPDQTVKPGSQSAPTPEIPAVKEPEESIKPKNTPDTTADDEIGETADTVEKGPEIVNKPAVAAKDKTPPAIEPPSDLTIEATGVQTRVGTSEVTARDLVDGEVEVSSDTPVTFPLGTTTVIWTAKDKAGNTATALQKVTVVDRTPPVIKPPANVTVDATGLKTKVGTGEATGTDLVDGPVAVTSNAPTTFPLGTTTVIWTARDKAGNTSSAEQSVTVKEVTPLTIAAPSDLTLEATGSLSHFDLVPPKASHAVGVVAFTNDVPMAGFPLGKTKVTWLGTDDSGKKASTTQVVTIVDTMPPAITVSADVMVDATGRETTVELEEPTATDAVGAVTISSDAPATFPLGVTTVIWTARDKAGNTSSAEQSVTVKEVTPFSIAAFSDLTLEATGSLSHLDLVPPKASHAVGVVTRTNDAPKAGFPLGKTKVTWSGTDESGKKALTTQVVTIVDTTPPSIIAPPDIKMSISGMRTRVNLVPPKTTDLVGVVSLTNDAPQKGFPPGETTVTWKATDAAGNIGEVTQQILIEGLDQDLNSLRLRVLGPATLWLYPAKDCSKATKKPCQPKPAGTQDALSIKLYYIYPLEGGSINFLNENIRLSIGDKVWNIPAGSLKDVTKKFRCFGTECAPIFGYGSEQFAFGIRTVGNVSSFFEIGVGNSDLRSLGGKPFLPVMLQIGSDVFNISVRFYEREGRN